MNKQQFNKLRNKIERKRGDAIKQAKALDAHCWPSSSSSAVWCDQARHRGVAAFASEILEILDHLENEE